MALHMERNYSLLGNQKLTKDKIQNVRRKSSRLRHFKEDDSINSAIAELKKSPCLIRILKTPVNKVNAENQQET